MDDLISREQAIQKMVGLFQEDVEMYGAEIPECFDSDRAEEALRELPSIETIYGYHFNELAFVASILAKEGVAPTELTRIIYDADMVVKILCKEREYKLRKSMEHAVYKWITREEEK